MSDVLKEITEGKPLDFFVNVIPGDTSWQVAEKLNQAGPNPMMKTYQLGFAGSAKIKRSAFGITSYVPNISDEVTLTLEAEFHQVPAA